MKLQLSVLTSIAVTALLNTTAFAEPHMPTAAEINQQESGGQSIVQGSQQEPRMPTAAEINQQESGG